nr:oxygenase MpaB family protein [Polyangium spumosum]
MGTKGTGMEGDAFVRPASVDRIPTEFQYWTNMKEAGAQKRRRRLRMLLGFDPVLPDELVRTFAYSYYDADPVAEAFVEDVYLARGQAAGRALVDRALECGVASIEDAPASLRALFAEVETEPAWLDWEKVELGARVWRRHGTHVFSFAGAATLEGYHECSVAKPLAFTGAYAGESAHRRFLETVAFWIDVSEPGGLRPGGTGRKTALRVRLMHVFVRKRLLRHPAWDLDAWGVPISQADGLVTLMAGSVGLVALKKLGYRTSREEIEALMHFWRYVGHLMGMQPRWYPPTYEDGLRLLFTTLEKGAKKAGEDGVVLARSYVRSYAPREGDPPLVALRKRLEYHIELGYTHFFVSSASFRAFGLPDPGLWRFHPYAQAPLVFALETARKHVGRIDDWAERFARRRAQQWLDAHLGPRRAEYKAVETFTR